MHPLDFIPMALVGVTNCKSDNMAARKTCAPIYLHLLAVIAKINRNNQVNAIKNEHSHFSEGPG